jgi:hypothetical protein
MTVKGENMRSFGIEWERTGRFMVGTLWVIEPGKAPVDLPHRLTLPLNIWGEYKAFLLSLGAVLDAGGLVDGAGSLADEMVEDTPAVLNLRPRGMKAGRREDE